jgi:WD40 repeat protein
VALYRGSVQDYIISASADKTLRLWNLESNKRTEEPVKTLEGHKGYITCMAAQGSIIVTGSTD